jgi:hypothetical protein
VRCMNFLGIYNVFFFFFCIFFFVYNIFDHYFLKIFWEKELLGRGLTVYDILY